MNPNESRIDAKPNIESATRTNQREVRFCSVDPSTEIGLLILEGLQRVLVLALHYEVVSAIVGEHEQNECDKNEGGDGITGLLDWWGAGVWLSIFEIASRWLDWLGHFIGNITFPRESLVVVDGYDQQFALWQPRYARRG